MNTEHYDLAKMRLLERELSEYPEHLRDGSRPDGEPQLPAQAPPGSPVTQRFVITSDPQFPRLSDHVGKGSVEEDLARRGIDSQYAAVNAYRRAHGGLASVPVFVDGDLSEDGLQHRVDAAYSLFKKLESNYYLGLGNHDCYSGHIASRNKAESCSRFVKHCQSQGLDLDVYEEGDGDPSYQKYTGSLAYAVDIGDFCFIQLNFIPALEFAFEGIVSFEKKLFRLTSSLPWLEPKLKDAQQRGKVIVLHVHTMHEPDCEASEPLVSAVLRKYDIAAIFYGHYHVLEASTYDGYLPCYCAGAAFKKTFLVAEYHKADDKVCVYFARDNVIDTSVPYVFDAHPKPLKVTEIVARRLENDIRVSPIFPARADAVEVLLRAPGVSDKTTTVVNEELKRTADFFGTGVTKGYTVTMTPISAAGVKGPSNTFKIDDYVGVVPEIYPPRNVVFFLPPDADDYPKRLERCGLEWDPPLKGATYGYKVTLASTKSGAPMYTLTRPLPQGHTRTEITFEQKLSLSPGSYRGYYLRVSTQLENGMVSTEVGLPLDDLLDQLDEINQRGMFSLPLDDVGRASELERLRAEKEVLWKALVDIDSQILRLE